MERFEAARSAAEESSIYIYIYVYVLEFDLSLYRDRVCWNPEIKLESSRVNTIRRFRHYVGIRQSIAKLHC